MNNSRKTDFPLKLSGESVFLYIMKLNEQIIIEKFVIVC